MTRPGNAVYLHDLGIVNALGRGKSAVVDGLMRGDSSGMLREEGWHPAKAMRVGRVVTTLPDVPDALALYRCRANQLLLAAADEIRVSIAAAIARFGAPRVGVIVGTSTSGIAEGEAAVAGLERDGHFPPGFDYAQQEIGRAAEFLATALGVSGPAYVVSTACTSSAKALASARNLLRANLCDAVVVGGADSLCRMTLGGFTALELTTDQLCNPMSLHRGGINIGEGAALFLMSREPSGIALTGIGESSDAHHISAPDPAGIGAELALRGALADAGIGAGQVDYVNLHGTATRQNDAMEAGAVARVIGANTPCSSTKPLTGHTLGAAGAVEAGFCWLTLSDYNTAAALPPHQWDGVADPELPSIMLVDKKNKREKKPCRIAMSNSFAFGGNNISLVLSRAT